MTITQTKSAERRKAERHGRSLQIAWRVLGNRHLRFGEAALKDIGTDGLALKVDQFCPKGTVVILQFAEAAERCAEPMLLKAEWSSELKPTEAGIPTYLMGCSFISPLLDKDLKALLASVKNSTAAPAPPKEAPAKTPARLDPFLVGSASEKRSLLRRGGLAVRVVLCRTARDTPVEASVVDRSLKGLGILIHRPFTRGTLLNVRPRDAHEKTSSVQVEVRNCRQKGKQWLLGCHFLHTPPANVLIHLG
jgi:PilZ domain